MVTGIPQIEGTFSFLCWEPMQGPRTSQKGQRSLSLGIFSSAQKGSVVLSGKLSPPMSSYEDDLKKKGNVLQILSIIWTS